jgi:hypothetical protein
LKVLPGKSVRLRVCIALFACIMHAKVLSRSSHLGLHVTDLLRSSHVGVYMQTCS